MVRFECYVICDGIDCPMEGAPFSADWRYAVYPLQLQKFLAEHQGWTFVQGKMFCPVCSGNRKLWALMRAKLAPYVILILASGYYLQKERLDTLPKNQNRL